MNATIYTDGSYNQTAKCYGCGAVILIDGKDPIRMHKTGYPEEGANGWNINGEIEAALMGIHKAIELGCDKITVHHDYEGVGKWPDGIWKTKKTYTKAYASEIKELRKTVSISFVHVKGHAGDKWNEMADEEAGIGSGLRKAGKKPAESRGDKSEKAAPPAADLQPSNERKAESQLPEGLNDIGKLAIIRFRRIKKPSFNDFKNLRTGGQDKFSGMATWDMEEEMGFETCEYIMNRVNNIDDYPAALRWAMRGLSADDAAHKVNVDREIKNNCQK